MSTIYQIEPKIVNIFTTIVSTGPTHKYLKTTLCRLHPTAISTSTKSIYQTVQPTIQPLAQNRNKSGAY